MKVSWYYNSQITRPLNPQHVYHITHELYNFCDLKNAIMPVSELTEARFSQNEAKLTVR